MDTKLTALEVLGLAIKSEDDAARYYDAIAKRIRNEIVKSKYDGLAQEERRHRELLVLLYRKLGGGDFYMPQLSDDVQTAEGLLKEVVEDLGDVLKAAIAQEEWAQAFYESAAFSSQNEGARRILLYLADQERGHAIVLRNELNSYLRDECWYMGNPDVQLVGP